MTKHLGLKKHPQLESRPAWKNPKRLLLRSSVVILGLTAYLTVLASLAKAESLYSEKTVTQMTDRCLDTLSEAQPETLTARNKCIKVLSSQFTTLSPEKFNFSIGALLLEYEQTPKMRRAIAAIIKAIAENPVVRTELIEQNSNGQFWGTVTDDVLIGYSIAYVFAFGKGSIGAYKELKLSGQTATGWSRLKTLLRAGLTETRVSSPYRTALVGVTSFNMGMLHWIAKERSIDGKKINPLDALDQLALGLVDSQCFKPVTAIELNLEILNAKPLAQVTLAEGAALKIKLGQLASDAAQIAMTVPSVTAPLTACSGRIENVTQRVKILLGKIALATQKDETEFDAETERLINEMEGNDDNWARENMCAPPAPISQICPVLP